MRIIDRRNTRKKRFNELLYGDVFSANGQVFFRIHEEDDYNAVCIGSATMCHFDDNEPVVEVNGSMVIEDFKS